jgi:transposase
MSPEERLEHLEQENQELRQQLRERDALIEHLLQRVQSLEERAAKDSHNSSLPPSSDRFARQKKVRSLRKPSGKKPGGQEGHAGATLEISEAPDEVIVLPAVTHCQHCQADLAAVEATRQERRQVVDVPVPRVQICEYRGEWKQCPHCQGYTCASFPPGVQASAQYGPRVGAMAVYLLIQQLLPWGRTCEVLSDLVGVQLSEGSLARLIERTATSLEAVEAQIKAALRRAKVLHQDETGLYVSGRRCWLHATSTNQLTHYQVHESRGHEALDAIGILADFRGISVHDGWATYFQYDCSHALCLVHILRELTFLAEELGLWWAAKLKRLLLAMKEATETARARGHACLSPPELAAFLIRFQTVVDEGDQLHPRLPPPKGHRGKAKQHPTRNLWDRLSKHQNAVLRFVHDLEVPFDNNLAERDIRMVKVQQKVSGAFRSSEGAGSFCRIRGYLSTLRKQGIQVFSALQATVSGQPVLPSFLET